MYVSFYLTHLGYVQLLVLYPYMSGWLLIDTAFSETFPTATPEMVSHIVSMMESGPGLLVRCANALTTRLSHQINGILDL